MRVPTLARYLVVAGALQAVVVGCSDTPSTPRPDVVTDTPPTEDQVTPKDTTPGEDRVQPDVTQDTAPDTVTEDVAPDTVTEDATPDAAPDAAPDGPDMDAPGDAGDDAAPDAAPDAAGDAADETVTEDVAPDVAPDVMMGECRTSADCMGSMGGPVCDTATNRCVPCTAAEDVCPVGNYCSMNRCVAGCRNAMDCAMGADGGVADGGGMACDLMTHTCVGCLADADCALGTVCRMNACVPGCAPGRGCGAGSTCCGTSCVNTQSDAMNCGACGTACGAGSTCCAGACVNTQTSPANCGACGTACSVANATAGCAAGACTVAACNAGFADCDMMAGNGCEVNTASTAAHCGRCGNACPAADNASPSCAAGACGFTCNTGFANCDMMAGNGCEVNTATSAAHCGACGTACPARANATPSCAAGACGFTCNAGFGNCNGNAADGCEANLNTSPASCGACGAVCRTTNGTPSCAAGVCGIATCNAGFGNCDMNVANGCETNTNTDRNNCGACGNRCSPSATCFAGACRDLCTAPLAICGSTCVDLQTNNSNCGACGTACAARANGTNACAAGACTLTCNRGFGNCDMNAANGCEVNLLSTTAHCGACGNACSFPNAAAACRNGTCERGACNAGFADCDGNPANGCEVDIRAMTANCGACGRVCSFANAAATCASSACALGTCSTGFGNCDSNAANGCETNLNQNTLHCGRCGNRCAAGQACFNGMCVASCPVGTTFCGGACVNTATDNNHCGACARVCPAGQRCTAGACAAVPPANDAPAGALPLNLSTPSSDYTASTTGATHTTDVPCLSATVGRGADVFYRFSLTRREFVYFDTFGSGFDTVLFLTTAAGAPVASQTAGDLVCNDDISTACTDGNLNSRIFTVLAPGDYLLVLSGYGTSSGNASIHFEHVPAGTGALAPLAAGASTVTGVTSTSTAGALTSGTCGGAGPENAYWWVTCPGMGTSTALTAETCGTAAFDTVLYLNTGSGFTACNDNACELQSRLSASYSLTTRLHALYVDGFASSSAGAYTLRVNRP